MLARRLLSGPYGAMNATWYGMLNGRNGGGGAAYFIGAMTSTDYGATWTDYASNPVIAAGTGWDASYVKDPCLIWDGSQYVAYYCGYSGTTFQIGRATSKDRVTWTKYGSNPVVANSSTSTDPDYVGCEFPVVHYDAADSPAWKMWYVGYPNGSSPPGSPLGTVCFADSSDGITWTKHGSVIPLGSAGTFDASSTFPGCVIKSGSTWYVFYTGYTTVTNFMHSAYATCSDPANAATYTKQGELANYTGSITVGGQTWRSNLPRAIVPSGGAYHCYMGLWNDAGLVGYEAMGVATSTDLTSWSAPSGLIFPIPGSGWDSFSAENPSVIVAP